MSDPLSTGIGPLSECVNELPDLLPLCPCLRFSDDGACVVHVQTLGGAHP